ncbi:MAG: arsenate reductase ArsC [Limisphaerales bacterium]
MNKKNVLFVCIHNSARSQMAEAFLNQICGDEFEAHSAGLEPGKLNPIVVEAMKEVGIDISGNQTKAVFDMFKSGKMFSYVITVCDETSAERCPIFPAINDQSYQTGYDKGRSDAVKQQYWLYVSMQQAKAGEDGRVRLYEVHLPEQVIDGVIFQPTTQFLRVEE